MEVEVKLRGTETRPPHRRARYVGVAVIVLVDGGHVVLEVVDRVVGVCPVGVGHVDVVDVVQFVVHTHGYGVCATVDDKIIGKRHDVLCQGIGSGIAVGADICRNSARGARILDYDARQGCAAVRVASVCHARVSRAEGVVHAVGKTRLQRYADVMGAAVVGVSRTCERECGERVAVILGTGVEVAVACRETVVAVDVPVEDGQQRAGALAYVATAVSAAVEAREGFVSCRYAVELIGCDRDALISRVV